MIAPRPRQRLVLHLLSLLVVVDSRASFGQTGAAPDSTAPITSMGFPTRYHWYAGGSVGSDRRDREAEVAGSAVAGFYHDLKQPASGILGFALEGYAGRISGANDGGMRALLTVRAIRFALGEDFSFKDGTHDFMLRYEDPILRGGFFRTGSMMRFEWLPGRHNSYNIGLTFPLFQPWAGKTRPFRHTYPVPPKVSVARNVPTPLVGHALAASRADAALGRAQAAALRFDNLTTALPDVGSPEKFAQRLSIAKRVMQIRDSDFPDGHIYTAEVSYYHRQLGVAFAAALGSETVTAATDSVTAQAREILLDKVLIPFDRRFGWFRSEDGLQALVDRSKEEFTAWAVRSPLVGGSSRADVIATYGKITEIVKATFSSEHERWNDSRLIWMPLQLGLRPEDHATQSQIDALIERLTESEFAEGNSVYYLPSERFTRGIIRTLSRTQDYHVLWIHDIKGGPSADDPDSVSARLVIDGYLATLTNAVNHYGTTGRIPTYLIFLDQWYYELQHGRFWLELLEDPLHKELSFGPHATGIEQRTKAAVQKLRAAVAASPELQAAAARNGQDWLRNLISVHINITNPGDPSFAGRLYPRDLTLAMSDDWMRDHRKVVFYDITEDDPGRGAAILTGEGVGRQYEEGAWEDRSLEIHGPAILALKGFARTLLRRQGFRPDQIPPPLRARPLPADYAAKVDSLIKIGWVGRVLPANAETGYEDKRASVAKAALYTLMPAGSRIVVPDSQWSSFLWGSMLAGAALRGCQVFVIGPGLDNAPYGRDSWPMFALQFDVFSALIQVGTILHQEIATAGGALHVGLYQGEVGTRDFDARIRELSAGVKRNQFLRESFPFAPALFDLVEDPDRMLKAIGASPQPDSQGDTVVRPKLHLKSQLYVSRDFVEHVLPLPAWRDIILASLRARLRQLDAPADTDSVTLAHRPNSFALLKPLAPALTARTPTERDWQVVYLSLGSQNQDDRSLMGNGELLTVVSGEAVLAGLTDYVYLVARATWLDTQADLDRELPPVSPFKRQLARWLRRLI